MSFLKKDFHKAKKDSMLVRVLISFLATAGLFYVNIMPALVDGLKQALHFTNQQAGLIGSANVYGAAVGALSIVFFVQKISWRSTSAFLLLLLISVDMASVYITDPSVLTIIRFIHGCIGGGLVGIGFAVIARTHQPERTFGMLLLVQFGFGGLGMLYIPMLVQQYGIVILYASLISFSLITLLMLPFISDYQLKTKTKATHLSTWQQLSKRPLQLTLLSIFLFQAANMGLYAFIVGLGKYYGLSIGFISVSLAWAAWIGIVGSLLVIWLSTHYGLLKPLVFGIVFTIIGTVMLLYSDMKSVWIIANLGVGITWAFVIPYLFSLCAKLDHNGQIAAMGGMASKLGLATGPVVTGFLLGKDNYVFIIVIASLVIAVSLVTSLIAVKLVE